MYKNYTKFGTLPSDFKKQLKRDMDIIIKIEEAETNKLNNIKEMQQLTNSLRNKYG